MDAETKTLLNEQMKTFESFKEANDTVQAEIKKLGEADVILREKVDQINNSLDKFEDMNQKLTLAQQQAKGAADKVDEIKEQADRIETAIKRSGAGGSADKKVELKTLVNLWARGVVLAETRGVANLPAEYRKAFDDIAAEHKALTVGTDTTAGYLAPTEYVRDIIKGVTEMSPIRSVVRVRQTANKAIQIPKRTGQFAAQWVAEAGTKVETNGLTYGLEELPAHELYALIDISNQMLEDSAFDMEAEIRLEASEQFAVAEGLAVVSGNGVGKPEGFMTNTSVQTTNSGSATTVADVNGQADGMITLFHAIKTAYSRDATWALNRTTLGSVRKLKDADRQYIWMPGLANGIPNSILGAPYVEMPDMPNEGAGLKPVAFGDFRRAYTLVDRIVMEMLRDPYTQATAGNVRYIFRRRLGGQVVLSEAIRTLTCSA
jgi:HK97 family phage major capsid protein